MKNIRDNMFKILILLIKLIGGILIGAILLVNIWPKIWVCLFGDMYNIHGNIHGKEIFVTCYDAFAVIITTVGILLGAFSWNRWKKEKWDIQFKIHQIDFFKGVVDLLYDYDAKIASLSWRSVKGVMVLEALYNKYRKREIKLLIDIAKTHDPIQRSDMLIKLNKLDVSFQKDAENAGVYESASILFRALNLLRTQILYLEKMINEYDPEGKMINACRENLLFTIRNFLSPHSQYVFGKYRHHRYKIDKRSVVYCETNYIGAKYADRVFLYERTLSQIKYSHDAIEQFLGDLRERYHKEDLLLKDNLFFNPFEC